MADTRVTLPGASLRHIPGMAYRAAYTPESITAAVLAIGTRRSAEYRAHLEQQGGRHD